MRSGIGHPFNATRAVAAVPNATSLTIRTSKNKPGVPVGGE
jgi:hypothetical protein